MRYAIDSLTKRGGSFRLSYHSVSDDGTIGKRIFRTIGGCRNKRDAVARASAFLADLSAEEKSPATRRKEQTMREFRLAQIEEMRSMKAIERSTRSGYLGDLNRLGELGDKLVSEVTRGDVVDYIAGLLEDGYCQNTAARQFALVRKILSDCLDAGLIESNPCRGLKPPRREETRPRALSSPERDRLLALLPALEGWLPVAIRLSLAAGLRRGEVCGLRWKDIDLAARTLSVRRAVARGGDGGGCYVKLPKTKSSRRTLPLEPSLAEALRGRMLTQMRRCAEAGIEFAEGLYVLGDIDGSFLVPGTLASRFAEVAKTFGIAGGECRFHWLRHTFATSMISAGVDVRTVAAWLGHSDPGFTLRVYVDLDERAMRESVAALSRTLELSEGYDASEFDGIAKATKSIAGSHEVRPLGRESGNIAMRQDPTMRRH